jgi:hypothetical protein
MKRLLLSNSSGPAIVPWAQSYSIMAEFAPTFILICAPPHKPLARRWALRGFAGDKETSNRTKLPTRNPFFNNIILKRLNPCPDSKLKLFAAL